MIIEKNVNVALIISLLIISSFTLAVVYSSQNSNQSQLIIESVYFGPRTVSGFLLNTTLRFESPKDFQMVSGPMLSCTFGIKIIDSPDWILNDSSAIHCPRITNRNYKAGSYLVSLMDFSFPIGRNTQFYFLTKLKIDAVGPNITSDPFYVVYEQ